MIIKKISLFKCLNNIKLFINIFRIRCNLNIIDSTLEIKELILFNRINLDKRHNTIIKS